MISRTLFLKLADSKSMEWIARKNPLAGRMTSRFVAGETVESIVEPVRQMNAQGAAASLDLLGEAVFEKSQVQETVDTYLKLFEITKRENLQSAFSVKLTALGLDIDQDFCVANMEQLLKAAGPSLFVQVDMEGSTHTQRTLDVVTQLWEVPDSLKNNGAVVQAYLHRTAEDVEKLISQGIRTRLCKGAYKESADVAFPEKADVDKNYIALMKRLLDDGNFPGLATHDPVIIDEAKAYVREKNIPRDRFEFQMLYGIRRDIQNQLLEEGYKLTVYTPFGEHWYPYFMRRLAERPANIWFVAKNLLHS